MRLRGRGRGVRSRGGRGTSLDLVGCGLRARRWRGCCGLGKGHGVRKTGVGGGGEEMEDERKPNRGAGPHVRKVSRCLAAMARRRVIVVDLSSINSVIRGGCSELQVRVAGWRYRGTEGMDGLAGWKSTCDGGWTYDPSCFANSQ